MDFPLTQQQVVESQFELVLLGFSFYMWEKAQTQQDTNVSLIGLLFVVHSFQLANPQATHN